MLRAPQARHGVALASLLAAMALVSEARAEGDGRPQPGAEGEGAAEGARAGEVRVEGPERARAASEAVVERDVLEAAFHRTASDLVSTVPGAFVTQHSGQGKAHQIFLRGFDAQHGQDVEIWVGGVPVNEPSHVHGQGYADLHFVMPEVVERVRALAGPYDVRQGDFAVAGSLYFDLGYDEPGLTVSGTLGSFAERRLFLAYHPEGASHASFAAVELGATDGFGPSRAAERASALGQLELELAGGARLRLLSTAYAARYASAGVVPLDEVERGRVDPYATLSPGQGGDSLRLSTALELRSSPESASPTSYSLSPYVVVRRSRLEQDFTGFLVDPRDGDRTEQAHRAFTLGATSRLARRFSLLSDRDEVSAGLQVRGDLAEQSQLRLARRDGSVTARLVDAELSVVDVAGFVDAETELARRLRLRAGLRVDGVHVGANDLARGEASAARSAMGLRAGAKATADLRLVGGLHLVASYGDGFRSPQARSVADGEPVPFTEVRSFEGGARWSMGEGVVAKGAVFHTRLTDDLVFDPLLARNEPTPASARTGLVAELVARPVHWLVSSTSLTHVSAVFTESGAGYEEGSLLPYVPRWLVRSDLGAEPRLGSVWNRPLSLRLGSALSYLGQRPLPFGELGRDVFVIDARAGLRLGEVELRFDATNLADARYYDGQFVQTASFSRGQAASLVPQTLVTLGQPRAFYATLSLYL